MPEVHKAMKKQWGKPNWNEQEFSIHPFFVEFENLGMPGTVLDPKGAVLAETNLAPFFPELTNYQHMIVRISFPLKLGSSSS